MSAITATITFHQGQERHTERHTIADSSRGKRFWSIAFYEAHQKMPVGLRLNAENHQSVMTLLHAWGEGIRPGPMLARHGTTTNVMRHGHVQLGTKTGDAGPPIIEVGWLTITFEEI